MKRSAFQFMLAIAAFFIGVSINNSCGESPIDDNLSSMYNSIRTLQNEVTNLRQEIKRLDSELAALKSTGGGSQGGASSEKYIDGLYFWHGSPTGLIKHYISSGYEHTTEYTYDKYGRIIENITHNISPSESTSKVSYEYVGKTVIQTITIDKYPDSTSQIITEYY